MENEENRVMSTSIVARMLQLLGLLALLYQPGVSYKLGGDSAVYTSTSDGSGLCHYSAGERPLGFSSQTSMDSEEAWFLDERNINLL